MCTFLVLQEGPCHRQLIWQFPSPTLLAGGPLLGGRQEIDHSRVISLHGGTETLLGLQGLLKQWVKYGLNHHLKLKILRMSEEIAQGYSHISVAHPSTLMSFERFC